MSRLSYSQLRMYGECGKKYEYSYVKKLRERTKSGALLFGTAFDKATEAVLKDTTVDEKAVFDAIWTNQEINGRVVYVPDSTLVGYSASDFDADLLLDEDKKFLAAKLAELVPELGEDAIQAMSQCASFKKQAAFRRFKENEQKYLNIGNWLSLRRKGHLMLETNRKEILPRIKKVLGTQVKIELGNDGGDTLLGYVDAYLQWDDGTDVVFDYKTSASEYDEGAVLVSPQLTIYTHALGVKRAGYLVFIKAIKKNKEKVCSKCSFIGTGSRAKTCTNEATGKRCSGEWTETVRPEARVQILVDDIPARTEEIVLDNIESINKAIKAEIYPRNLNACTGGFRCPYINLCYKNDDSDLEKIG